MLAPLNSTMIAVALPDVMDDFGVGVASAGWLITAYLAAMASLQPVAGKLGDRLGRRRMVLGGLVAFGAMSVGAALAPSLWILLAFRTLQAVAGALIVPNGSALLREAVPEGRRGATFGSLGAAIALAAGLGPPIGGILVEIAGWRAIFYANLAIVIPGLLGSKLIDPRLPHIPLPHPDRSSVCRSSLSSSVIVRNALRTSVVTSPLLATQSNSSDPRYPGIGM